MGEPTRKGGGENDDPTEEPKARQLGGVAGNV